MSKVDNFNWKRFWVPLGTKLQTDFYGFPKTNEAKTLADLEEHPCIMLLGEPSIGKSTEINEVTTEGDYIICRYNLNKFSSEQMLFDAIENLDEFKCWQNSSTRMYLYLDGLDEAYLNIKTIHNSIADWIFRKRKQFRIVGDDDIEEDGPVPIRNSLLHQSGLYLRITCRSASWTKEISQSLEEVYGAGNVSNYEMVPLDFACIKIAAEAEKLNVDDFTKLVKKIGAISFATEPLTLITLIELYKSGRLSDHEGKRQELYFQMCLRLCDETKVMYRGHASLSAKDRLIIASRLATYMTITNRNGIWTNIDPPQDELPGIHYNDITGDTFTFKEQVITLKLHDIRETLNTSLFKILDEKRLEFRSKSFAEYLTAWHLNTIGISDSQIRQLLTSPFDDLKILPQLHEVARWLVLMNDTAFNLLQDHNPFLILKSGRIFDVSQRRKIVQTLLELSSKFDITDDSDYGKHYVKLAHPGLDKVLTALISDKRASPITRRIVIDLAGACKVIKLVDQLQAVVLDTSDDYYIRKQSAVALTNIDHGESINLFRQLALTNNILDVDDELKGVALKKLYPKHISTEETLQALTVVKRDSLFGAYRAFLMSMGDLIPDGDLDTAVQSVLTKDHLFEYESYGNFTDLVDTILNRAITKATSSSSFQLAANLILKLNKYRGFKILLDDEKRKELLRSLIDIDDGNEKNALDLLYYGRPSVLLRSNDWEWLVELLRVSSSSKRVTIANFLWMLLDFTNSSRVVDMLEMMFSYDELKNFRPHFINAIALESADAQKMRRAYRGSVTISGKKRNKAKDLVATFSMSDEIQKLLQNFSLDNLDPWWRIIFQLRINQSQGIFSHSHDIEFEITKLPGWNDISEDVKKQLKQTAKTYIERYQAQPIWILSKTFNRPDLALYKALLLLGRDAIDKVTDDQWQDWHAIIIFCSLNTLNELSEIRKYILTKCAKANSANNRFYDTLNDYLLFRLNEKHDLYDLYKLDDIVNERVAAILLKLLDHKNCTAKSHDFILETLFKHKSMVAEKVCVKVIKKLGAKNNTNRTKEVLIAAAAQLLLNPVGFKWSEYWNMMEKNPVIAREVFIRAAPHLGYGESRQIASLATDQRLAILLWMYRHFPPEQDPTHNTAYIVGALDNIADYRAQIIRSLIEEGSLESVAALRFADKALALPTIDFKWWSIAARENMWRKTWCPPAAEELKHYLNKSNYRFVRSHLELLQLVEESLLRLQAKLKGNNSPSYFLWNSFRQGSIVVYDHKDENALSDFVKMHLEYDLKERKVIINREVEIKRSTRKGDGSRTDLLVQAIADDSTDTLNLVIETKGCWNEDIDSAMESQLKKKYMSKYKAKVGIYLIGWYYCSHFKPRKSNTLEIIKQKYALQAKGLSNEDIQIASVVLECTL